MNVQLSTRQVADLCGVPLKTLYDWLRLEVIPSVPARVKGRRYPGFSARQVTMIRLAADMRRSHFALDDIRDGLRVLNANWNGNPPGQLFADRLGWRFEQRFLVEVDGEVHPLVAAPPILWDLGKVLRSVLDAINEMEAAHASDGSD